jgi:hypothetical protein
MPNDYNTFDGKPPRPHQHRMPFFAQTILISGSRNPTPPMEHAVIAIVGWAWKWHLRIIVGDAYGVDAIVVREIVAHNHAPTHDLDYTVYGLTTRPRNGASMRHYCRLDFKPGREGYRARDRFMADQADYVYCVWNGESPGTKALYDYANTLTGKSVALRTFLQR